MSNPVDLWALAKEEQTKQASATRRAIVVGPKSAGKTSLLRMLRGESDEGLRATKIVDFTYFKGPTRKAQFIDCYDLEGGMSFKELIPSFLSKQSYKETTIVLVVDMSKPGQMAELIGRWLQTIREGVSTFFQNKLSSAQFNQHYTQNLIRCSQLTDKDSITPMPLNTMIVGSKYDLFKSFDPEQKKWAVRMLRYISHVNACHLSYACNKAPLGTESRTFIGSVLAGEIPKRNSIDYQTPFMVGFGCDQMSRMDLPRAESKSLSVQDSLARMVCQKFNYKSSNQKEEQLLDWQKYRETKIDEVIKEMLRGSRAIDADK